MIFVVVVAVVLVVGDVFELDEYFKDVAENPLGVVLVVDVQGNHSTDMVTVQIMNSA